MSKRLDYKLGFFTKKKSVKGDVGIEVELEGNLYGFPTPPKYWLTKPENSLRGGVEFVLKNPIPMIELPHALAEYQLSMDKSKPKKSIRCSTHIHVNVLDKTVREIYNILAYYFLVEDLLVRTQGSVRMGNLFCLRMSDAESIGPSLYRSIVSEEYFRHFSMNHFKYGAVNLAAPSKFGSLEFRFLRPITDTDGLKFWCDLLYDLVQKACKFSVEETTQNVQSLSAKDFLKLIWSDEVVNYLGQFYLEDEVSDLLTNNLDYVLAISKAMKKISHKIIPESYVENDLMDVSQIVASSEDEDEDEAELHFEDEEFYPDQDDHFNPEEDFGPNEPQETPNLVWFGNMPQMSTQDHPHQNSPQPMSINTMLGQWIPVTTQGPADDNF